MGEELLGHDRADRVAAEILGARAAAAVAIEAGQRIGAAGLELAAEDVALRLAREPHCSSADRRRSDLRGLDADAPAAHALAVDRRGDPLGLGGGHREEREVLEHLDVAHGLAVDLRRRA